MNTVSDNNIVRKECLGEYIANEKYKYSILKKIKIFTPKK